MLHIGMAYGSLFAFAGRWDRRKDRASGEIVRSFSIVTTRPNELCAPIHNWMPMILDEADHALARRGDGECGGRRSRASSESSLTAVFEVT
jgi:hypothetical protein